MYPKNAASPEPIAIGAVVQISDGAVQTSGVTVRIKPIGVAEGDGGGSTAYSTDGIVLYTPTQAETNYTSFILIAKKAGCIPVAVTVVTTATATPGTVVVTTNNDKTGYALSVTPPTAAQIQAELEENGASLLDTIADIVGSATYGNSALKTLLDTIAAYIDTEVASILAAVDTEIATLTTELAKVPKSDGVVTFNATALASIKSALEAAGSHLALIKAKTDLGLINTTWTDAKAAYLDQAISAAKTLTVAYDLAKTAAQPADIPTANITAIKAQTDKMNFHGDHITADMMEVHDTELDGTGVLGDEWRPV